MRSSRAKPAAMLLGIGLGGFLDGIVLHQIAQWHGMLSARVPPHASMEAMRLNMAADGWFHLAAWLVTFAGVMLLWSGSRDARPRISTRAFLGYMLVGWGAFNLAEGIVNHHLLQLHHVRDLPAHVPLYDWAFLLIGGIGVLLIGLKMRGGPSTHLKETDMRKILGPAVHGVLDYGLALAFLLLPGLLEFSASAANLSYVIGVVYLGASLLTRYPLGAIKLIPFPVHGVIETLMAASWIVMPWVFGFAADAAARNFFVMAGVGLLLVAACTDYKSTHTGAFGGRERRHAMVDRRERSTPIARDRRIGVRDRREGYAAA